MKKETIEKGNTLLNEIEASETYLQDMLKLKQRAELEIENGGKHTLSVKIMNPANSVFLLLIDEMDLLETAILKCEKYIKRQQQVFDKLKDE